MNAARVLEPLLAPVQAGPTCRITLWDGRVVGPSSADLGILVRNRRAVRRLLWAPSALGLAFAYVEGELDVEGGLIEALDAGERYGEAIRGRASIARWRQIGAAARLGALAGDPRPPLIEAKLEGRRHSRRRDAQAVRHHYDLGNEFYELLLANR